MQYVICEAIWQLRMIKTLLFAVNIVHNLSLRPGKEVGLILNCSFVRVNALWDTVPSLKAKRERVDLMFAFLFLIVIVDCKVTIIRTNLGLLG